MSDTPNVVFVVNFVKNETELAKKPSEQKKYGEKRRFYSCKDGGDMDYLRYVDKGTREPNEIIEDDYVGYSGDNEKGSGLFSGKGFLDRRDRFELRKELQTTQSTIWHGIISFEEAFGKRYCADAEQAHRLMALEFPRFLKNAGFDPAKVTWYAGLHENTDNRHIHFSFHEREPSTYRSNTKGLVFKNGKLDDRCFERFKVAAELRMTDITSLIAASRKELTDLTRNILFTRESKKWYHDDLQKMLRQFADILPRIGRVAYDSENMRELRPQVRQIVNNLIKSNSRVYYAFEDFCTQIRNKDAAILKVLKSSKVRESEWPKYMLADKLLDDVYKRLGNQIINAVRFIKNNEVITKNRKANKRQRRKTILAVMTYALKLDSEIEQEAMDCFAEYLEKLKNTKLVIDGGYESEMD